MLKEDDELLAKCLAKTGCEEPHHCLLLPFADFKRATGLGDSQAKHAWALLAHKAYDWHAHLATASSPRLADSWIRLLDPNITQCLNDGIRLGTVTEIVGESASGKTQLCLQLSIAAQLPREFGGQEGKVIYISTEGAFPAHRLKVMAAAYVKEYADRVNAGGFLNNISVAEFEDWETMGHAIRYKVPALLSHGQVRLVIIDSIAAHLRFDTEQDSSSRTAGEFYKQRSGFLIEAGQMFRSWASEYNCAVVCVNQVKDVFDQPQSQPRLLSDVSDMSVVPQTAKELCYKDFAALGMNSKAPALGNLWANAIDARITLYYRRGLSQAEARATEQEGELVEVPNELLRTRRWLELSFAPWCSRRTCEIALDDRGFYSFGINSHEIDEVGGVF